MHEQRHMRTFQRAHITGPHARAEPRHAISELLQNTGEERVLLEAITTAMSAAHLSPNAFEVGRDRLTEMDVEILEGDARCVCQMDAFQRVEIGRRRALVADARAIR